MKHIFFLILLSCAVLTTPQASQGEQPANESTEVTDLSARSRFAKDFISNRKRSIDPFGLPMDPNEEISHPESEISYNENDYMSERKLALEQALNSLPITGVYPQSKRIVLGAKTIKKGSIFGIRILNETVQVEFAGIQGNDAFFKDVETNEVAKLSLRSNPQGIFTAADSETSTVQKGIIPMNQLYIAN